MYVRFRAVAFIVWKLVQSQTLVLQSWGSGALLGHYGAHTFKHILGTEGEHIFGVRAGARE